MSELDLVKAITKQPVIDNLNVSLHFDDYEGGIYENDP